jgi:hypothetical protein
MEVVSYSETSANLYWNIQFQILEDSTFEVRKFAYIVIR